MGNQTFVVVGMSFECQTDKFLLTALGRVQDDLPIGESQWLVVNPDPAALTASCSRLQQVLPRAEVKNMSATLVGWLDAGVPELQARGAIAA